MSLPVTITALANLMMAAPKDLRVVPPVLNTFSEGLYCRSIFIPKGTLIVGKVHKRETLNICSLGDITVLTEKGVKRFRAGDIAVSAPGIQKVGYAHEDSIWVNVHATNERDLAKIEEEFIDNSHNNFDPHEFMEKVRGT